MRGEDGRGAFKYDYIQIIRQRERERGGWKERESEIPRVLARAT